MIFSAFAGSAKAVRFGVPKSALVLSRRMSRWRWTSIRPNSLRSPWAFSIHLAQRLGAEDREQAVSPSAPFDSSAISRRKFIARRISFEFSPRRPRRRAPCSRGDPVREAGGAGARAAADPEAEGLGELLVARRGQSGGGISEVGEVALEHLSDEGLRVDLALEAESAARDLEEPAAPNQLQAKNGRVRPRLSSATALPSVLARAQPRRRAACAAE